jgi:hypothetical protein
MYKYFILLISLLVITIFALNIGVLQTMTFLSAKESVDISLSANNVKRVSVIEYKASTTNIKYIKFRYNTPHEAVTYGDTSGKGPSIKHILQLGEFINKIKVYNAINSSGANGRGGGYVFVTNIGRELKAFPNNKLERKLSYTLPFYGRLGEDGEPSAKPIIGLKWVNSFGMRDLSILNNVAANPNGTTVVNDSSRHAIPVGIELGITPPNWNSTALQLFKRVENETGFKFNLVTNSSLDNTSAIAEFFDDVFEIDIDSIIAGNRINTDNHNYYKLIRFTKVLMDYGYKNIDECINSLADIRTIKTQQGFTTIEGLNTKGELTNEEATCYLHNSVKARREVVGSTMASDTIAVPGLKYRIFNSYFGMNINNGGVNLFPNRWQEEFESYRTKLRPLNSDNGKCRFHPNLLRTDTQEYRNAGVYTWNWIARRNYLVPCIIAEGTTTDLYYIKEMTKKPEGGSVLDNNDTGEYYTIELSGYFKPDTTGIWCFRCVSDDGAHFLIGGNRGGSPGLHGMADWDRIYTFRLEKDNYYDFLMVMGENWGGDNLFFQYGCVPDDMANYNSPAKLSNPRDIYWKSLIKTDGYFFLNPGSMTDDYSPQSSYSPEILAKAKQHWIDNGSNQTLATCTINMDIRPNPINMKDVYPNEITNHYPSHIQDMINSCPSSNPNECGFGNNDVSVMNLEYNRNTNAPVNVPSQVVASAANSLLAQGKQRGVYISSGSILPKVEEFTEGMRINEPKFILYLQALGNYGIEKEELPQKLKEYAVKFKVDIQDVKQIQALLTNFIDFNIRSEDDFDDFEILMKSQYRNFVTSSEYLEFMRMMISINLYYDGDSGQLAQYMDKITGYRINTFQKLKYFKKACEEIGITDVNSAIDALIAFGVTSYPAAVGNNGFIHKYKAYINSDTSVNGLLDIQKMTTFGVRIESFDNFISVDSNGVNYKLLKDYIDSHINFGVYYVNNRGSSKVYSYLKTILKAFKFSSNMNLYINYMTPTIPQMNSESEQELFKLNQYRAMGINNIGDYNYIYKDSPTQLGSKSRFNVEELITDETLLKFFEIDKRDRANYSDYKNRFAKTIQHMTSLGFNDVCNYFEFLKKLHTSLKYTYSTFKKDLSNKKTLFGTEYANYLNCNNKVSTKKPTTSSQASIYQAEDIPDEMSADMASTVRSGFTTYSESFVEGNMPDILASVNSLGINYYGEAVKDSKSSTWIDLNSFNQTLKTFDVNTPEDYDVFINSLNEFHITQYNFVEYTTLLLDFGVRVKTVKDFTNYITIIGVKYEGFKKFISIVMKLGVRMPDFVTFLCYIYSFGVTYDGDNDNSVFYKFLNTMISYGLLYKPAPDGMPGIAFMNAIDNFVYMVTRAQNKIDCAKASELMSKKSKVPQYVKYFFRPSEGVHLPANSPISRPIVDILDVIQTHDKELKDFAIKNRFIESGKLGFTPNTVIINGQFSLNLFDESLGRVPNIRSLYGDFYTFTNKFIVSQSKLIDIIALTSHIVESEYRILREKKYFSIQTLITTLERMEKYNIETNGKPDFANAYNKYAETINMLKMFPYFSQAVIVKYFSTSSDLDIPKDDIRATMNPDNLRCKPYINVEYNQNDCKKELFTNYSTGFGSSYNWNNSISSKTSPVQIYHNPNVLNQQTPPLLTIQNSNLFATYNPRDKYSNVNW